MKEHMSVEELSCSIHEDAASMRDYLGNSAITEQKKIFFKKTQIHINQYVKMDLIDDGAGFPDTVLRITPSSSPPSSWGLTRSAHDQFAARLHIPIPFYQTLLNSKHLDDVKLLVKICNHRLTQKRVRENQLLYRTCRGMLQAVLSKSYQRIDHHHVIDAMLHTIDALGCQVRSCSVTEKSLYIKAISPKVSGEVSPGDVVRGGLIITNSQIGRGALQVRPFIERLVCRNGMTVSSLTDKNFRKVHLGKHHLGKHQPDKPGMHILPVAGISDHVLQEIEQGTAACLDESVLNTVIKSLAAASKLNMVCPRSAIHQTRLEYKLTGQEEKLAYSSLVSSGELSAYGICNALTDTSKHVISFDRASELEAVAWKVILSAVHSNSGAWNRIASAIHKDN